MNMNHKLTKIAVALNTRVTGVPKECMEQRNANL